MRNIGGILLILALLAVFLLPGLSQSAQGPQSPAQSNAAIGPFPDTTGTPVAALPIAMFQPTNTPTVTPTPTNTATPTSTATATATAPPAQPMVGSLRREDPNRPSYATHIEDIWHWFWIRNNNPSTVYYGVLGVNVLGPVSFFHTSWSGELAPNGVLEILGGGCFGPNGYPCAGSSGTGEQRDKVIVTHPGTYTLHLHICQSSFSACTTAGAGQWSDSLSSVSFVAVNWTPTPSAHAIAPTQDPQPVCQLITDDPRGTYLRCDE